MDKIDLEKCHKVEFSKGITLVMYWVATIEGVDDVDLLGNDLDPKEDYKSKFRLKEEVQEWLDNNVTAPVYIDLKNLYFVNAEDAMAFKLRWT